MWLRLLAIVVTTTLIVAPAGSATADPGGNLSAGCEAANDPIHDTTYLGTSEPLTGFAVGERLTVSTDDGIAFYVGGDVGFIIEQVPVGEPNTISYTFAGPPADELIAQWANTSIVIAPTAPTLWAVTCTGVPTVSPYGVIVDPEGDGGTITTWQLPVFLSEPSAQEVTVAYETVDDATPMTASSGSDYVATAGTVTFAPGETVQFVNVDILGDDNDEVPLYGGEWGLVRFFDVSNNAALDTTTFFGHGLFIIRDDD